jgi:hypothetical protein
MQRLVSRQNTILPRSVRARDFDCVHPVHAPNSARSDLVSFTQSAGATRTDKRSTYAADARGMNEQLFEAPELALTRVEAADAHDVSPATLDRLVQQTW